MKHLRVALAGGLLVLAASPAVAAQLPFRPALEAEIKQRGEDDAKRSQPQATPESLKILFGEEAKQAGLSMREVDRIYTDAYKAAKAKEPWWQTLKPQLGWAVAILLGILLFLRDFLRDCVSDLFKRFRGLLYSRLAGSRRFRKAALRHYRRAIVKKYEQLKVPFRPDRPLEMRRIYVPLKAKTGTKAEQIDTFRTILQHRRLMIVGAPGAGKSMLMRHLALGFADAGLIDPATVVPVLLELNRVNESQLGIRDHLVETFRLNEFPHAEEFVDLSLSQGNLTLLFDGLDEVSSQKRAAVVKQIQDFLDEFDKVPTIITCRTAVYHQEFTATVEATLEIDDFSDDQIYRFLESWQPEMPEGKSVEQLIQTLRDRPRIMALARNPLLLTIIAYLYCDTEFILPHSRTEFYDQATGWLLQQWKQERNRFKLAQKRLVLQSLALLNQDRGATSSGDRKSIEFQAVLSEVRKLLPALNLEDKDAQALVDEIVERSGLLLAIDGGERYQFAHLTLQEFFAACELRARADDLRCRFLKDPTTWRETVKLWCGLETDSTYLVKAIFQCDPVIALECLADAQKMDATLAEDILAGLKPRLAESGETGDAIRRGFAAVASDLRPRGRKVFDYLAELLQTADTLAARQSAAEALSYTNLPRAVQVLGSRMDGAPEIRHALVRMGDLSVPNLAQAAAAGAVEAVDDLRQIGTPRAAMAMVPLLWSRHEAVSLRAAWSLAVLLRRESIESALALCSLNRDWHAGAFSWVWRPFDESGTSPLSVIAGRITQRLDAAELGDLPNTGDLLDERIVIPLCTSTLARSFKAHEFFKLPDETARQFHSIMGMAYSAAGDEKEDARSRKMQEALEKCLAAVETSSLAPEAELALAEISVNSVCSDAKWKRLFSALRADLRCPLILRLIRGPHATVSDWVELNHPLKFQFTGSPHFIVALLLGIALSLLAGYEIWAMLKGWKCFLTLGMFAWYSLIAFVALSEVCEDDPVWTSGLLFGPIAAPAIGHDLVPTESQPGRILVGLFMVTLVFGWPGMVVWGIFKGLLQYFGWPRLLLLFGGVYGVFVYAVLRGTALHRKARNIFHGVLVRRAGLGQRGLFSTHTLAQPLKSSLFRMLPRIGVHLKNETRS